MVKIKKFFQCVGVILLGALATLAGILFVALFGLGRLLLLASPYVIAVVVLAWLFGVDLSTFPHLTRETSP